MLNLGKNQPSFFLQNTMLTRFRTDAGRNINAFSHTMLERDIDKNLTVRVVNSGN